MGAAYSNSSAWRGWLEMGDTAEVEWRPRLGESEMLGPRALVTKRLCNCRQGGANLGYKICSQISPSYDLTWWLSAFDGPPGERDDRRIYAVGMMQRQCGLLGTWCPMTDEERGVKKRKPGT